MLIKNYEKFQRSFRITPDIAIKLNVKMDDADKILREKRIIESLIQRKIIQNAVDVESLDRFTSLSGKTVYSTLNKTGKFKIGFDEFANPIKSIEKNPTKIYPPTIKGRLQMFYERFFPNKDGWFLPTNTYTYHF